jgi:hypothetical protein
MNYKDNAESLASKMNKLSETLDLSEDLLVSGDDIVDYVEDTTKKIDLSKEVNYADIMNLEIMTEDFRFVRSTLKEVTENARRVQNAVTVDLLSDDDVDSRASLIISFAELSKAITDAQKLYVLSYKEMSTTLLNLDKIKQNDESSGSGSSVTNNNLHIYDPVTTADLIKKLKGND